MNIRYRRYFEITTESIEDFKIQLTCYDKLGQSTLTRRSVTCCEREIAEFCISTDSKSTGRMMTLASSYFEVAKAKQRIVKWIIRI
jgi:hypothetical protein